MEEEMPMALTDDDLAKIQDMFVQERTYTRGLFEAERKHTRGLFEAERKHTRGLLNTERENTRAIIEEVVKREVGALSEQISSFVEDNFNPAIDSLQGQISEIRRDMKRMRVVVD
jgi:hypothetical protein